jgi:hypothetical protein
MQFGTKSEGRSLRRNLIAAILPAPGPFKVVYITVFGFLHRKSYFADLIMTFCQKIFFNIGLETNLK